MGFHFRRILHKVENVAKTAVTTSINPVQAARTKVAPFVSRAGHLIPSKQALKNTPRGIVKGAAVVLAPFTGGASLAYLNGGKVTQRNTKTAIAILGTEAVIAGGAAVALGGAGAAGYGGASGVAASQAGGTSAASAYLAGGAASAAAGAGSAAGVAGVAGGSTLTFGGVLTGLGALATTALRVLGVTQGSGNAGGVNVAPGGVNVETPGSGPFGGGDGGSNGGAYSSDTLGYVLAGVVALVVIVAIVKRK